MRTYLEFVPPLANWLISLAVLALFLLVAAFGVQRGWPRPGARALWVIWTLIAIGAFLHADGTPEPTRMRHLIPPSVRITAVTLLGAFVLLGIASAFFDRSSGKYPVTRAVEALVGGIIAVPIALIASAILSCALDLGCI
jgi:hypothetical protein